MLKFIFCGFNSGDVPIFYFALNKLTLTPEIHFVQFYFRVVLYFLSWGENKKECDTLYEAVMKIKIGISVIDILSAHP